MLHSGMMPLLNSVSRADSGRVMNALLDTLIPGDDDFPSAGSLGLHEALLAHDRFGAPYAAVSDLLPEEFANLSTEARARHINEIESREPDLFNGLIVGEPSGPPFPCPVSWSCAASWAPRRPWYSWSWWWFFRPSPVPFSDP